VPKYSGSPLDPPLRSRFQARDVRQLPYTQQLQQLISLAPSLDKETLTRLLSLRCRIGALSSLYSIYIQTLFEVPVGIGIR
jgi:hypothetical protein